MSLEFPIADRLTADGGAISQSISVQIVALQLISDVWGLYKSTVNEARI